MFYVLPCGNTMLEQRTLCKGYTISQWILGIGSHHNQQWQDHWRQVDPLTPAPLNFKLWTKDTDFFNINLSRTEVNVLILCHDKSRRLFPIGTQCCSYTLQTKETHFTAWRENCWYHTRSRISVGFILMITQCYSYKIRTQSCDWSFHTHLLTHIIEHTKKPVEAISGKYWSQADS